MKNHCLFSIFLLISFVFPFWVYGVVFARSNLSADVGPITTPSVPEFTVEYVDYSYDVPPVYGIDQFTGKEVITKHGYHVDERSVVFKIKNQPFTSYNDSNGHEINLYFNFRFKGHYGEAWEYYPFSESGRGTRRYATPFIRLTDESPKIPASNSEYTDKVLSLAFLFSSNKPTTGSQIDFQVQAIIGHIDSVGDGYSGFTGERSPWSSTQTITVGENTQDIPEFSSGLLLPLFLTSILAVVIYRKRMNS
jgi:hypothetical protein